MLKYGLKCYTVVMVPCYLKKTTTLTCLPVIVHLSGTIILHLFIITQQAEARLRMVGRGGGQLCVLKNCEVSYEISVTFFSQKEVK